MVSSTARLAGDHQLAHLRRVIIQQRSRARVHSDLFTLDDTKMRDRPRTNQQCSHSGWRRRTKRTTNECVTLGARTHTPVGLMMRKRSTLGLAGPVAPVSSPSSRRRRGQCGDAFMRNCASPIRIENVYEVDRRLFLV